MKYSKSAYWEILYPFAVSLTLGVGFLFIENLISINFKGLVNASLNLFGILIGFFITVLTIINTIENSYTRALKEGDSFHLLSMYLKHAIWACFISIILSIIHVMFYDALKLKYESIINTIFILGLILALITSYRFIRIFLKLILK